jgi:hypothetical protein
MNVPPRDRENTTCPSAARATAAVTSSGWNARSHRTPSPAPGRVRERTIMRRSVPYSRGMRTRLARSIPARSPRSRTAPSMPRTSVVNPSCKWKEVAENPVSGGRMLAAEKERPSGTSNWATAWQITQPMALL